MAFEKTPAGTRGQRMPGVGSPVAKWLNKQTDQAAAAARAAVAVSRARTRWC